MQQLLTGLTAYGTTFLISAATIAIAVIIAWLANVERTVTSHVCRVGRQPARVEVPDAHGTVAVSVRPMDASHVWLRVEAPPDATVRAVGDGESLKGQDHEIDRDTTDGPERRVVVPADGGAGAAAGGL
jgi:hypothetical protein